MAKIKFFSVSSGRKQSEISLVYQSVAESTLGPALSSSPRGQYERIGNDGASSSNSGKHAGTENKRGSNGPKTLKLGGNSAGRVTRSRVRIVCLLKAPANFISMVKEQYALWKDGARIANIRVGDLFVANQVFMHVQATPVKRKQQGLKPSVGFVTRVEAPSSGQGEMRER